MSFKRCPGSSAFAQPKIEMISCPDCGGDVELWSDEADGTCLSCGRSVIRTASQSCIDWCRYANECLGEEKYKKYREMKAALRKEALLRAVQDMLAGDPDRKRRVKAAAKVADRLLSAEPDADPNVVIAAAILAEVHDAEAVRGVLAELNYPQGFINEVSSILDGSAAAPTSLNARLAREAAKAPAG